MKKKSIEELMSEEIKMMVPNTPPKIDFETIIIPQDITDSSEKRTLFPLRKVLVLMTSLLVVMFLSITVANQLGLFQNTTTLTTSTTSQTVNNTITNPITELNAKEYALPIITASQLSVSYSQLTKLGYSLKLAAPVLLMDEYIALVNQYMNALEFSLSPDTSLFEVLVSDNPLYPYLISLSETDSLGKNVTYRLYYNITENDDDEIKIEGTVLVNETKSYFTGKIENESSEEKIVLKIYETEFESDTYVYTEFKLEDDETSYKVMAYQDNKMVSSSVIKFEIEESKQKVVVKLYDEDDEINFSIKTDIEEDKVKIKVKYDITKNNFSESGTMDVSIIAKPLLNGYSYQYIVKSGNTTKTYEMDRVGDSESKITGFVI